jgi:hypothetical protein
LAVDQPDLKVSILILLETSTVWLRNGYAKEIPKRQNTKPLEDLASSENTYYTINGCF